jgi:hypothetical protein
MSLRRSLMLNTKCKWHEVNECIFFRPLRDSIAFVTREPTVQTVAIFELFSNVAARRILSLPLPQNLGND